MDVRDCVVEKYKEIYSHGDNSTVLAAFLLRNKLGQQLTVCSLSTGTKSIPYPLVKQFKDKIIHDLHAEVLARKGFIKFITKENSIIQDLFVQDKKRGKLQFNKQKYQLIFYSSEPPCGDCSIQKHNELYSGARPLEKFLQKDLPDEQKYTKSILRTKPSRLDLPIDKRSLSLCCSDKMMLWNVLGVQGRKLFTRFKPIYIDTIILQKDESLLQSTIQNGVSIISRIGNLCNLTEKQIQDKLFKIKIDKKIKYFTHQFKLNQPSYTFLPKQFNKQKISGGPVSIIYSIDQKVQEINGKTGLLQGASLKHINKNIGISSYSDCKLFSDIIPLEQKYQYSAVKSQIKELFGGWKDNFK